MKRKKENYHFGYVFMFATSPLPFDNHFQISKCTGTTNFTIIEVTCCDWHIVSDISGDSCKS